MMVSPMPTADAPFTMPSANRPRDNAFTAASRSSGVGGPANTGPASPAFSLGGNLGHKSSLGNELMSVMNHPAGGDLWGSGNESRSHQATMASFWASERVGMARNSGMLDMLESFGGLSMSGTYYGGSELTGSEVKDKIGDIKEDEIWEASQDVLDEVIDDIERRAEAAMHPVDENGNPISVDEAANDAVTEAGSTDQTATETGSRTARSAAVSAASGEKAHNAAKPASTAGAESSRAFRIYSANQQSRPSAPETPTVDVQA